MAFTRRALLERIGAVGGAGAAYLAMEAMGLAIPTPAGAENFRLPAISGKPPKVVILGAGVAGLVSAYELRRAGYRVSVLEARDRIGGRVWTIRGGDKIEQTGRPDQHATFDPGLYFNAGPARIPSTHRLILEYARRFGVQMETFVNINRSAGWDFAGRVFPERRMVFDFHGRISELLAKAIDQHALDQEVPKAELEILRGFLAAWGSLDDKGRYVPRGSSGYEVEGGGYARNPVPLPPLTLKDLERGRGIALPFLFESIWDMQPTMLQPVGGMDRIVEAIYEQVKPSVRLRTQVTAIRRVGDRVRIEHGSARQMIEADHCICTLPIPILQRIPNDFSPVKKAAIASATRILRSVKLAFEAPRFWEQDDFIYGGLAWTDRLNENVIYPSEAYGSPKGVLVGAYCAGWTVQGNPDKFSGLSHEERFRISRESIEALHPGRARLLRKGVTVAWGLTPYSEGVGVLWGGTPGNPAKRGADYLELLKPEGPIVFAGEHLSYQGTWQEGAAMSAHEALKLVAAMAQGKAA